MRYILCFLLLPLSGCIHVPQTITLLGETIHFPVGIDDARKALRLDRSTQGRYYRVNSADCKIISSSFLSKESMDEAEWGRATIWGVNFAIDTAQMTLLDVIKQVEKDTEVTFTKDNSFIKGTAYYRASKGAIDIAIRQGGNLAFFNTEKIDPAITSCITLPRTKSHTVNVYVTYGLSSAKLKMYLQTDGITVYHDD